MKVILELIDLIEEQLDTGKDFAERFVMLNSTNNDYAERFKKMAEEEVEHSKILFSFTQSEIDRLNETYKLPVDVSEICNRKQAKFIEKAAWIKQMLTM